MYYYTTYFGLRRWLGKILLIRFRWHVTHIWNSTWSQFNMIKSRIVNAAFTVLCITIKLIGSNSTRIILWLTRSNLWKNIFFLNVFIKSILLNPVFFYLFLKVVVLKYRKQDVHLLCDINGVIFWQIFFHLIFHNLIHTPVSM